MSVTNEECAACKRFQHPTEDDQFGKVEVRSRITLSPFKAERPLARSDSVEKRSS